MRHGIPGRLGMELPRELQRHRRHPLRHETNGFDGLGAEYVFNKTKLVGHMERVKKFLDDGILELAGQGINPAQLFIGGQCSTIIQSTAGHAAVEAGAKFNWSATFLPTEKDSPAKNSTIGGAALWTLKGHKDEVYKGVAAFYNFLGNVEHAGLVAPGDRLRAGDPGCL